MRYQQRTIHLIDTPGFSDTKRTESEILEEIAYWLTTAYDNGVMVSGLVFLHRITDPRLQGSSLRALTLFKKICGTENYKGVVLATTRWDELIPSERFMASSRQKELCDNDQFWGDIRRGGGQAIALSAARIDALKILKHFIRKDERYTLAIQEEMIDEGKRLHETAAGQFAYKLLTKDQEQHLYEYFDKVKIDLQDQISTGSEDMKSRDEWRIEYENAVHTREQDMSRLQLGARELQEKWNERLQDGLESIVQNSDWEHTSSQGAAIQNAAQDSSSIKESQDVLFHKQSILVTRKTKIPGTSSRLTAVSWVGAGLAGAQLVAALACTVM